MTTRPSATATWLNTRPPRILDVIDAVKRLARAHPEIGVWWYAPAPRRKLVGELTSGPARVEVAVETALGASPDHERLGRELGTLLGVEGVVRAHRGAGESTTLFRLARAPKRGVE